jgi:hypothetical protein
LKGEVERVQVSWGKSHHVGGCGNRGKDGDKDDKEGEQVLPVKKRTDQCSQCDTQEITGHI